MVEYRVILSDRGSLPGFGSWMGDKEDFSEEGYDNQLLALKALWGHCNSAAA